MKTKFPNSVKDIQAVCDAISSTAKVVNPKTIPMVVKDKPDNQVLAIVHAAKIDVIVTGDKELLALKKYRRVPIVTVNQFLSRHEDALRVQYRLEDA